MTAQLVTPLPPPPSRRNPVDFNTRADNWNDALVVLTEQINKATPGDSAAGLAQYLALTGDGQGTELVAHKVSATGAVARMLRERLSEHISVRDFGAKGDWNGTTGTDDTAAIQAAIDYVQGNSSIASTTAGYLGTQQLYFPAGRYKITSPLLITRRIVLRGEDGAEFAQGARLVKTTAGDLLRFTPSGGGLSFSIENLTLSNEYSTPGGGGHLVNVQPGLPGYNSWRIKGCCFTNPQSLAIRACGNDVRIIGNTFDVSPADCIQLGSNAAGDVCSDVVIAHNDFFGIVLRCVLLYNAYGVVVSDNVVTQPSTTSKTLGFVEAFDTLPAQCKRLVVSNNTTAGVRRLLGVQGGSDITFTGNTCTDSGMGTGETVDAIVLAGTVKGVTIASNEVRGQYESRSMLRASAGVTDVLIAPNNWINDGGAGDCMVLTGMTGKLDTANNFSSFLRNVTATNYYALGYILRGSTNLTYGTSITADASLADDFVITVTNGTAFTVNNALNGSAGQRIRYMIRNASGGAMGTITWASVYKLASFTNPANGFSRTIEFRNDGTNWVEQARTPSDVPN
jgi:hypothetical protein